jgi:hypothetical protein
MLSMIVPVMHVHFRKDAAGSLEVTEAGVSYKETKRAKKPHDYTWTWNDIERLTLYPDRVEIVTWKRNRPILAGTYTFKAKDAEALYPLFREKLPRRFIPEVARTDFEASARLPAVRDGQEGTLLVGADRLVFESEGAKGSHTWVMGEIENVSTADPLELTISSLATDYRLKLKQPLPEGLYNDLWRKLNIRSTHP